MKILPLGCILLFAFALRNFGWNWDEGTLLHPDERHMAMVTVALETPESFLEGLDGGTSSFTPYNQGIHSYVYGQLPLKLVHALTVHQGERDLTEIVRLGRLVSALFSTATVALLYAFASRLISHRIALLVALLQACVVISIQQAHFYTIDSAGTFFATACVGFGLMFAKTKRMAPLVLSGTLVGLAMACRINLGLLAPWVIIVGSVSAFKDRSLKPLMGVALGGACALFLFRIMHPMAFSGWGLNPRWIQDLESVHNISRGMVEVPFTLQWVGRIPFLFALQNLVIFSIGLPLGIFTLVGIGICVWPLRKSACTWTCFAALWPLMLFFYHARIFLHTQRYFYPAIPTMVFCAGLVLYRLAPSRFFNLVSRIVVISSILYALAFVNLYRDTHPRIQASEWLYQELPLGGTVLTEHWDDALPLRLESFVEEHGRITIDQAEVYLPESPQKIRRFLEQIDDADFYVMSSTRASHSLPRMPNRYPVMTRLYEGLQEGPCFGLKEVERFHRQPHLLGFRVNSLFAEEAYRVYDHPLVRIFEKTPDFNPETVFQELTTGIDFEHIPEIRYLNAGKQNAGRLTPDQLERRSTGSPWSAQFSLDSFGARNPVIIWTLVLFLLGPLSLPLSFFLFPKQRDRGATVSRLFGLCLIAWAAWLPAALELIPFQTSLLISSMGIAGISMSIWVLKADQLLPWIRRSWRTLIPGEVVCWVIFALFLLLRSKQPELWHPWAGGEKPMDFAYINATSLTSFFPPENPWFSGAFIHYYYYGFVLVATLIHLTGIPPEIAVNLALASFAFFTAGAAYGLGTALYSLFRRGPGWGGAAWAGSLAAFLTLIPGNLAQVREYLTPGFPTNHNQIYWNASRAIQVPQGEVAPITEFPLFSHLYGDLHAHLMALPIAMLCTLISWQLFRSFHRLRVGAFSLVLGTVWATNTWDLPIQAAIFLFACIFPAWRDRKWIPRICWGFGGLFLAKILFLPFHQSFSGPPLVFQFWQGPTSSLLDLFLVHGLFLVPLLIGGILWIKTSRNEWKTAHLFPLLCTLGCLFLIIFLEFVHMQGDIGRMNFVFKFTYQVWWILACITAVVAVRFFGRRHLVFSGISLLLLACGLTYTVTAIPAKLTEWKWSSPKHSLNGMAYMDTAIWELDGSPIRLADDKAAIDWLRKHASPGSVILEGTRPLYQWGGRISWHTGLPTVIGWDWHMRQQRSWPGGDKAVYQRLNDVRRFFERADTSVLDRYNVSYVVLGKLEQLTYGTEALVRVSRMPEVSPVFASGSTTVYSVKKTE